MTLTILEKIKEILQPIVDRSDVFLVDLQIRGELSSKVVEVYVDTDTGISLEQCSVISRELSTKLDEEDIIQGRYRLDVSSPGLDRPLKLLRQYQKNIGRNCKVSINEDGKKTFFEGTLEKASSDSITIVLKGKPFQIEFSKIIETFIIPKIK